MKLVGICGPARAGKDTIANRLVYEHDWFSFAFADPIKEMTSIFLQESVIHLEKVKDEENVFFGVSPRKVMQTLGTEWGRNIIGTDVWIKHMYRRIEDFRIMMNPVGIVIPDVRFQNEVDFIRDYGGEIWRVTRPQFTDNVRSHASEEVWKTFHADREFINAIEGDISPLQVLVDVYQSRIQHQRPEI